MEESKEYKVYRDEYGITIKTRKSGTSTPLYIDFPIKSRKDFNEYKEHHDTDYLKDFQKNGKIYPDS